MWWPSVYTFSCHTYFVTQKYNWSMQINLACDSPTNKMSCVECPWWALPLIKRYLFNPIALRKAKIVYNFGFS